MTKLPVLRDIGEDALLDIGASDSFDVIVVGAGVSGSLIADDLTKAGKSVLVLEAGRYYKPNEYPRKEIDAQSQLYWSGGIELNTSADIGLLRPKVVGGGSVVNQADMNRFDEIAFGDWRNVSGVSWFNQDALAPYYQSAEGRLHIQTIDPKYRNNNAKIFADGFEKNGFKCAPLVRAQRDCMFEDGNDCIECLSGCPIQSKQSAPWTTLARARDTGKLKLVAQFEVMNVSETHDGVEVMGTRGGQARRFRGKVLVLASGAIGNTKLLMQSGFAHDYDALGHRFFTHPQFMHLATFTHDIHAEKGPLQSVQSDDPNFRKDGFKLENVFAPPVSLAMLVPGIGVDFLKAMRRVTQMACIEVAVRDTNPGKISLNRSGRVKIEKTLNDEDKRRKAKGFAAVDAIFSKSGCEKVIQGGFGIGLHLMGGCGMGVDRKNSVVGPDFKLHGKKRMYAADSSIFPSAPGINPSLTIMAISARASQQICQEI